MIKVYYWPGGGKEGQFPPGFRKRGEKRLATKTHQDSFKSKAFANVAMTTDNVKQNFVLMTMGDSTFEILSVLALITNNIPDNSPSPSSSNQIHQINE